MLAIFIRYHQWERSQHFVNRNGTVRFALTKINAVFRLLRDQCRRLKACYMRTIARARQAGILSFRIRRSRPNLPRSQRLAMQTASTFREARLASHPLTGIGIDQNLPKGEQGYGPSLRHLAARSGCAAKWSPGISPTSAWHHAETERVRHSFQLTALRLGKLQPSVPRPGCP